jgi:Protein of unknown function (DUF1579)
MKKLLVIAIALAVVAPCLAQTAQTPQPPKPGPEVHKLGYFVGTWKSEGEVKVGSPSNPAGKFSGTETCEWFAGGFQIVCRGEDTGPLGKMTFLDILSYDVEAKVYIGYFISSRGETESDTITVTGNTWTSTWEGKEAGKPEKVRYTQVQESPTSYTFKVERSVAGGPWTVIEEGKGTKAK